MKRLRQLCAGLILTFALSVGAFAGQVNCPGLTQQSSDEALTPAGGDQPHDNMTETMILFILALV
jgi:microcystin-dependent protein